MTRLWLRVFLTHGEHPAIIEAVEVGLAIKVSQRIPTDALAVFHHKAILVTITEEVSNQPVSKWEKWSTM